jgi:hypothetical protein
MQSGYMPQNRGNIYFCKLKVSYKISHYFLYRHENAIAEPIMVFLIHLYISRYAKPYVDCPEQFTINTIELKLEISD